MHSQIEPKNRQSVVEKTPLYGLAVRKQLQFFPRVHEDNIAKLANRL